MAAVLVALIALALLAEPDAYPRRWSASATGSATLPFTGVRDVSGTGAFEVGYEPRPWLRLFNFGTAMAPPARSSVADPFPRILLGVEGVVTPLLPLELALGAALGPAIVTVNGVFEAHTHFELTTHARVFAGFRPVDWLTVGMLFSWNTVTVSAMPYWFELGARVGLRW